MTAILLAIAALNVNMNAVKQFEIKNYEITMWTIKYIVNFISPPQQNFPTEMICNPSKCKHVHGSILITDGRIYKECRKCGQLF